MSAMVMLYSHLTSYVRGATGAEVVDDDELAAIRRDVLAAVSSSE